MTSKILGESFLGSGALGGTADADNSGLGGTWNSWGGGLFVSNSSIVSPGGKTWNRSASGGTLTPDGDFAYYTARINSFSFVRGTGVLTLEVSAYGAIAITVDTTTEGILLNGISGVWAFSSPNVTGSFTAVDPSFAVLHTYRIETEATETRFYIDGTQVATSTRGLATTSTINGLGASFFDGAADSQQLILNYLSMKSETTTGALGRQSSTPPPPPIVPIYWLGSNLSGSGSIQATSEGGGTWDAQNVSPTSGFTTGDIVRTNGGVVFTPSADALAVILEWGRYTSVTGYHPSIELGYTYVRLAFYGNPTVTLGMLTGASGPAYQIQVQPTTPTAALVGVGANVSPSTAASLSTATSKRTLLVFQLSASGLSIYADGSSSAIYTDAATYGSDAQLRSIRLEWSIAPVTGAMFAPGRTAARALDWIEFEQGVVSNTALFSSIPAQPALPVPYVAPSTPRVVIPKIYGKYTVAGKTKLIVPSGTTVSSAANYGAKSSSTTVTTTLATTSGNNVNSKVAANDSISITMPVLLSDAVAGPGPVVVNQTVISDPPHLVRTGSGPTPQVTVLSNPGFQDPNNSNIKAPPTYARYGPPNDSDQNTYITQVRGSKYVPSGEWMESVAVSNVSGTGERFSHWEYKPTVWASYAGWVVVFDGFIPLIKVPTVLVTVPATYTTAPVLVPGPDIRTLRINLTIKDLVLPEDLTTETASFEVAFTGAQRLAVADGPADGEPFDSVVVADTISDDTVKRLKITIYPEYKAKKKTVLEATPKFSEFWTAFKASHEVPADSSTS